MILALYSALVRCTWRLGLVLGFPGQERDKDIPAPVQQRAIKLMKGPEHLPYEERLRELGLFSLEKRRLKGILSVCTNI